MLREGRFEKSMDPEAAEYSASIEDDLRLFEAVVQINLAHVKMLKDNGIVDESDVNEILEALQGLHEEGLDALDLRPEVEDIHMAIEEYVEDQVGEEIAGKMHTAKSRNDQVSTAIRMVLREEILGIQERLVELVEAMKELAEEHTKTIMPGYTHHQVAEPTTFAHYLNAYSQAFARSLSRLDGAYERTNKCPLGACALSGTSFPIDRDSTALLLGFDGVSENTLDATGSRDFALQTMSDLAILMTSVSRFAEELALWGADEFDMLEIPDEFSSTSSIMPQKKNPVIAELERAKTGRVVGDLVGGLNIMKALTQAYNLDFQELTPLLWDSVGQVKASLRVMKKLVNGLEPKPENMRENAEQGFATLTELANMLVREGGVSFRKSHSIVGKLAAQAQENDKSLSDLTADDLHSASSEVVGEEIEISEEKFEEALDLDKSIEKRQIVGGPSPESVKNEFSKLAKRVENHRNIIEEEKKALAKSKDNLLEL